MKSEIIKYSIIDLETTGANREGQKITEVAIINYDGDQIESTYSSLVNPERYIGYNIQKLTGITNEMVENAPKFYEIAKDIVQMTEGRVIVAHNVFFDYRFLQREFRDLGYLFKRDVYCTCKMARSVFPGLPSYSLKNLMHYFELKQLNPHRAMSDTDDCLKLFQLINKKESEPNSTFVASSFDHLIPAQLINFNFKDYPESPGLYFMYDNNKTLLYVGKSSNVRSRLKQHFKIFEGKKREQELKNQVTHVEFVNTYHPLPTSILELSYIKTLRPKYNRANRKTRMRYALVLNPQSDQIGEEIKVSTSVADVSTYYQFGSKKGAYFEKAKIYTDAFGINLFDPNFLDQLKLFKRSLGEKNFSEKLAKSYQKRDVDLNNRIIEDLEWSINFEENKLCSITLHKHTPDMQIIKINESSDMRHILLALLKKGRHL